MRFSALNLNEMSSDEADITQHFIFINAEFEASPTILESVFASIENPSRLSPGNPLFVPFERAENAEDAYRRIMLDIDEYRPAGMLIQIDLVGCGTTRTQQYH